jgi:hypothetical protein
MNTEKIIIHEGLYLSYVEAVRVDPVNNQLMCCQWYDFNFNKTVSHKLPVSYFTRINHLGSGWRYATKKEIESFNNKF